MFAGANSPRSRATNSLTWNPAVLPPTLLATAPRDEGDGYGSPRADPALIIDGKNVVDCSMICQVSIRVISRRIRRPGNQARSGRCNASNVLTAERLVPNDAAMSGQVISHSTCLCSIPIIWSARPTAASINTAGPICESSLGQANVTRISVPHLPMYCITECIRGTRTSHRLSEAAMAPGVPGKVSGLSNSRGCPIRHGRWHRSPVHK